MNINLNIHLNTAKWYFNSTLVLYKIEYCVFKHFFLTSIYKDLKAGCNLFQYRL